MALPLNIPTGEIGAVNAALLARARVHHVREFAGPLSIKVVLDGAVAWSRGKRELKINETSFLVLNAGEPYSMNIDERRPVSTFSSQVSSSRCTPDWLRAIRIWWTRGRWNSSRASTPETRRQLRRVPSSDRRGRRFSGAYLTRRLDRARHLLAHTGSPVGDIAAAVGLESALTFSALFRRRFGVSPTQARIMPANSQD